MNVIADFVVHGRPEPKGSWSIYQPPNGRARLIPAYNVKRKDGTRSDARERYAAWTRAVTAAATVWQLSHRRKLVDNEPLRVEIGFFLPRPVSTPKRIPYPIRKPDLDKLARLALDCLTQAGLITDDARIVELVVSKRFALSKPCARIIVASLAEVAA